MFNSISMSSQHVRRVDEACMMRTALPMPWACEARKCLCKAQPDVEMSCMPVVCVYASARLALTYASPSPKQSTLREANTTHITYKDGMQLIHFPNNQMEKHFPDGSREVRLRQNSAEERALKGTHTRTHLSISRSSSCLPLRPPDHLSRSLSVSRTRIRTTGYCSTR